MYHCGIPFYNSLFFDVPGKKNVPKSGETGSGNHLLLVLMDYFYLCSQLWLPTVQEVLHADWQDVWHSPHPPFFTVFCKLFVFKVLMCFMAHSSFIVVDARLFYSLRPLALSIIA